MKKKIIFVIDSLRIGGAERSLLDLLRNINFSLYEVSLQLFGYDGKFMNQIPSEVNVLPQIDFINLMSLKLNKIWNHPFILFKRLLFSFLIRYKKLDNIDTTVLYWKLFKYCIPSYSVSYYAAIAYSQGLPSLYVIDKIKANIKILWMNTTYPLRGKNLLFYRSYYSKSNYIIMVSEKVQEYFITNLYPEFKEKCKIIKDIIDYKNIIQKAKVNFVFERNPQIPIILTVGRLERDYKGFDLSLITAKILKNMGVNFIWLVIGDGPFLNEMNYFIKKNKMENYYIILGETDNPYPYMSSCDIYVQTSRKEGFCLTVAEAKLFNKPMVLTPFETAQIHLKNRKTGLIASFDPKNIADKIKLLIEDKKLCKKFEKNLQKEKKGNLEEIKKFYQLIELNN